MVWDTKALTTLGASYLHKVSLKPQFKILIKSTWNTGGWLFTEDFTQIMVWDTKALTTLGAGYLHKVETLKHLKHWGLVIYQRFHSNQGLRH